MIENRPTLNRNSCPFGKPSTGCSVSIQIPFPVTFTIEIESSHSEFKPFTCFGNDETGTMMHAAQLIEVYASIHADAKASNGDDGMQSLI